MEENSNYFRRTTSKYQQRSREFHPNVRISDTRTARKSTAWSSGTGMAKDSSGTTAPAASRLSSSVKCSDQIAGQAGGTINAQEYSHANRLAARPQNDPGGSCV